MHIHHRSSLNINATTEALVIGFPWLTVLRLSVDYNKLRSLILWERMDVYDS